MPRTSHTATLLPDGRVLVAGGVGSGLLATAEVYDPATGTWSPTGSMLLPRFQHSATLLPNGKVLVAGGETFNHQSATAELYDPATGLWSLTAAMTLPRSAHTATLLPDGKVLVAGGANDYIDVGSTPQAEVYDPVNGTWSRTGSMAWAHAYHQAVLLPTGQVLVSGGGLGGFATAFASAELYEPATGTWSLTGSMASTRKFLSLTLLPSGKVLATGGGTCTGPYHPAPNGGACLDVGVTATAELYDPATGTWSPTASMTSPRMQQTASVLPDGRVLVAKGWNASGQGLTTVEVYDPATGTWCPTGTLTSTPQTTMTPLPNGQVLSVGQGAGVYTP